MVIDVDGAPNAYGPPDKPTLDDEFNGHEGTVTTGRVVGYLTEDDGVTPKLQGENDPYPGYYISCTAFYDRRNANPLDPRRYLDASRINYVVRGALAEQHRVALGDFAAVHSRKSGKSVFAIVGDSGNDSGAEGSLALLQSLGYPFDSGKTGEVPEGEIVIRFFPGSNPERRFFKSQAEIDEAARALGLNRDFDTP